MPVPFFSVSPNRASETILASPGPGARPSLQVPGMNFVSNGRQACKLPREHRQAALDQGWVIHEPPVPPREVTAEEARARQDAAERASWVKIPAGAPKARVIPPAGAHLVIEGRAYTSKDGAAFDAPLSDARVLAANGWLLFGHSGALPGRPAQPRTGEIFVETPTERVMQFDGRAWRDVHTGTCIA